MVGLLTVAASYINLRSITLHTDVIDALLPSDVKDKSTTGATVWGIILEMLALRLFDEVLDVALTVVSDELRSELEQRARIAFFQAVLTQPVADVDRVSGAELQRHLADAPFAIFDVTLIPVRLLRYCITLIGGIWAMVQLDWRLLLAAWVLRLPISLNVAAYTQKLLALHWRHGEDVTSRVSAFVTEALGQIRLIQVHTAEGRETERYRAFLHEGRTSASTMRVIEKSIARTTTLFNLLLEMGTLAVASQRIMLGSLTIGGFMGFSKHNPQTIQSFDAILHETGRLRQSARRCTTFFAILDAHEQRVARDAQLAKEGVAEEAAAATGPAVALLDNTESTALSAAADASTGLRRRKHGDGSTTGTASAAAVEGAASIPAPAPIPAPVTPRASLQRVQHRMRGDIELSNVWLAYPSRSGGAASTTAVMPSAAALADDYAAVSSSPGSTSKPASRSASLRSASTSSGGDAAAAAAAASPSTGSTTPAAASGSGSRSGSAASGFTMASAAAAAGAGDPFTLRGVTCRFRQGSVTALVGASGGGKTSILRLLLSMYQASAPPPGHTDEPSYARIDGRDVSQWRLFDLRRQVAYIDQEATLLNRSIRENLQLGLPDDEQPSEAEMVRACKAAHIYDTIAAFPHGLDTVVGDRGVRLSSGERQRIAIARAFLRDPAVVLADEITANLDAISELKVKEGLQELMKGRTVITVAHRLSMAMLADQILVCEGGRIVESGTVDELLAPGCGSRFAHFVECQAGGTAERVASAAAASALRASSSSSSRSGAAPAVISPVAAAASAALPAGGGVTPAAPRSPDAGGTAIDTPISDSDGSAGVHGDSKLDSSLGIPQTLSCASDGGLA